MAANPQSCDTGSVVVVRYRPTDNCAPLEPDFLQLTRYPVSDVIHLNSPEFRYDNCAPWSRRSHFRMYNML